MTRLPGVVAALACLAAAPVGAQSVEFVATRYGQDGSITAQRLWYVYPMTAVWDGAGDRNVSKSHTCKSRE